MILVAEDDRDSAEVLQEMLSMEGHVAELTHTATDTIAALRTKKFSAVLMDLTLPGMSISTFVTRISEVKDRPPIVIISAREEQEIRAAGDTIGATGILQKPACFGEIVDMIQRALKDANSQEA